jgi:hypothetical protein
VSLVVDQVQAAPNGDLTIHAHAEVDRYALGVTTLRGMAARLPTFEVELKAKTAWQRLSTSRPCAALNRRGRRMTTPRGMSCRRVVPS